METFIRRVLATSGAAVLLVGGLCAAFWIVERRSLVVDPAQYEARAAQYRVTIRRDTRGIPHVHGARDADAAFGLAYAHAEDDFETIRNVVVAIRGELAAVKGPSAAPGDYLVRMMRVWELIDARYDTLSPEVRAIAEAYADGINLWAARHPKALVPGFLPMRGEDVAAGFVFKTPLFYGLDGALRELTRPSRARPLAQPPTALLSVPQAPWGSNAIAVAPSRSDDGATRLWINSHQPLTGPVAWYEAHLQSDEGLDVYGGTFPGAPLILHGFNRSIGWANTVNRPDLYDVYHLTLNPKNPNQYLLDGEWRDFERDVAKIEVRLISTLRWTFERPLLRSEHGPVLETEHGLYALRYVGMNEVRQLEEYYRLNRAGGLEAFLDALRLHVLPSINYTYADAEGHIAYVYNARFPKRAVGWDWHAYLPGDRSELIWNAFEPFDALPRVIDPMSGLVGNANHTPFAATDGPDNPVPSDFPPEWGIERHMTNRGHRLLELWGGEETISREEMIRFKFDHGYSPDSRQGRAIRALLDFDFEGDPLLEPAQTVLARWDRQTHVDSREAALGVLTLDRAFREHDDPITLPPHALLRDSFREAALHLRRHFGRLDPGWGELNRLRRGAVDLPVSGGPDVLRAVYGRREPDGTLTATNGDGFMALVEWGPTGERRAWGLHQYGAHVRDPNAPHATDQMRDFVQESLRPIPLTEDEIAAATERAYSP